MEEGGPLDLSVNDGVPQASEGGIEGVEQRWLEQVDEATREGYRTGKGELSFWTLIEVVSDIEIVSCRLSATISTLFCSHRHHSLSVPLHPGEGSVRMVL